MRTRLTLFLLAVTAAAAFSQAGIVVVSDTVPRVKHKSPNIAVATCSIKHQSSNITVVSDTLPWAKYKPFNKVPADTSRKKIPKGSAPDFKKPPVDPKAKNVDSLTKRQSTIDRMPNAIAVQPFPSANNAYRGNNGKGFDIYESNIDRMPVLMPDSVNAGMLRLPKISRKPKQ